MPRTPAWLVGLHALPMYLGLDLRGGVHFLMQVDMKAAVDKRIEALTGDVRTLLRGKSVRHAGITRQGQAIQIKFRDEATRQQANGVIRDNTPELALREDRDGDDLTLVATLSPVAQKDIQDNALKQNITTLHNRVNELGVAEPVIQQQGADRIVIQLPGVQDVARAKQIIGRTATLEIRLVDQDAMASGSQGALNVPERRDGQIVRQVPLKREVAVTGEQLVRASSTFDQNQRPAVAVSLDNSGGNAMRQVTRENLGKLMAIVLYEKGKGEAISVATIQGEFGNQFQITGSFTPQETADLSLLIRAGSLAAPMEIIEERTIGPSLGAENIQRGLHSTIYGFAAISLFMILYYRVFGLISVVALSVNVMLLIALLSMLQATLDAARHRRHRADARHGDRRQRADQRARARGAAQRQDAAAGDRRGLRQGVRHHPRLQHHDADRRRRAAAVRLRTGARLRGGALPRHPDLDLHRGVRVARDRQPRLRLPQETGRPQHRRRVEAESGRGHEVDRKHRPTGHRAKHHGILPHPAARFRSCGTR